MPRRHRHGHCDLSSRRNNELPGPSNGGAIQLAVCCAGHWTDVTSRVIETLLIDIIVERVLPESIFCLRDFFEGKNNVIFTLLEVTFKSLLNVTL